MAFLRSFSSGPKSSISPVKSRASAAYLSGCRSAGSSDVVPTPLLPCGQRRPQRSRRIAQRRNQSQAGDDNAAGLWRRNSWSS